MKKYFSIISIFLLVIFLVNSELPQAKGPEDLIVGHDKKESNL